MRRRRTAGQADQPLIRHLSLYLHEQSNGAMHLAALPDFPRRVNFVNGVDVPIAIDVGKRIAFTQCFATAS